jgi:hypothetical protein
MKKPKTYQEKSKEPTRFNTRVFIPCAGDESRWNEYLGVPKQLVDIDGEPLLHRTVRCLKDRGLNDILIIGNNPKFAVDGVQTYSPHAYRWIVETIKSTESLWKQKNIILLGDVWFSPESFDNIISTNAPIVVFGRKCDSKLTGCRWGEIFALVFRDTEAPRVSRVLDIAIAYAEQGNSSSWQGLLWSFYYIYLNIYMGDPLTSNVIDDSLFYELDDFTEDFDFPIDYDMWMANRSSYQQRNS